ncbi:MAG TPA: CHAD domain-containing protein, partial [Candidatus Polarisedimenticolaceae bacterium]|nr:CHAD domain-containing protein [Candidatus Polarisedimenticolaceae bacterium]
VPPGTAAAARIRRRTQRFRRAVKAVRRRASGDAVHALRIEGKKLRYTLEFFAPLLPVVASETVLALAEFQDRLGAYQDVRVAGQLASQLRAEVREPADGDYLYVLGLLAGAGSEAERAAAQAARDALDALGRRPTRELIEAAAELEREEAHT